MCTFVSAVDKYRDFRHVSDSRNVVACFSYFFPTKGESRTQVSDYVCLSGRLVRIIYLILRRTATFCDTAERNDERDDGDGEYFLLVSRFMTNLPYSHRI